MSLKITCDSCGTELSKRKDTVINNVRHDLCPKCVETVLILFDLIKLTPIDDYLRRVHQELHKALAQGDLDGVQGRDSRKRIDADETKG